MAFLWYATVHVSSDVPTLRMTAHMCRTHEAEVCLSSAAEIGRLPLHSELCWACHSLAVGLCATTGVRDRSPIGRGTDGVRESLPLGALGCVSGVLMTGDSASGSDFVDASGCMLCDCTPPLSTNEFRRWRSRLEVAEGEDGVRPWMAVAGGK